MSDTGSRSTKVVLVHGFLDDHTAWDDVAARLGDEFETVALDLPGFGSRVHDEVLSVEAFDSVLEAQTVITDWRTIQPPAATQQSRLENSRRLRRYRDRRSPAQPTPTLIAAAGPTNGGPSPAHCSTSQRLKELLGRRARRIRPAARQPANR